jgi:hypothetical protein
MLIDIPATLSRTRDAIASLGGDVATFEIGPPATVQDVVEIERRIERDIPQALRRVLLEQSAGLRFSWTVERRAPVPKIFRNDLAGSIELTLSELPTDMVNWFGWRDAFEYPEEYGLPTDLTVQDYEELFPLVAAVNGDQIVVADPTNNPSDAVMYLNHEAGDFNFVILADTLEDFLNTWIPLGCPGPEWWELAPFIDTKTLKLSLNTRLSRAWLRTLTSAL